MKEIKFRGKDIKINEWIYGDLIQLSNGRKYIVNNKFGACIDDKDNFINTENPFVCEVIPETVGQYTGLKDDSGNELYEHDIINLILTGSCSEAPEEWEFDEKTYIGEIYFNNGYDVKTKDYCPSLTHYCRKSIKKIGNKFDNPELIEN